MKFAQTLATHVTPEWRSQYIDYDLMKEMLYQAILSLPAVDTDEDGEIQGDSEAILAKFNQEFFTYADKELAKVNTFFAEKLSEALRKFATLKNALKFFQFREEPGENGKKFGRRMVRPNASTLFRKSEQEREMSKQYKKVNDLKLAFSEFYLSLVLLQNYQNLNYQGFRKIMKKHDKLLKITTGTDWRSRNVDSSPFYADKEIDRLITEVENLVTNELEKGDRTKAMKRLRVPPLAERTTSWDFFRNGFVSGSFLILMTATIVSSITHGLPKGMKWLDVVRLYRGLFLLIAFTFLAGINVNGWAKAGVNHVLIFELDPRTHLSHHNMLEIAGVLANLWCITFLGLIFSDEMHIPGPVWPLIFWVR